ncbi:MAG: hypothetical protein ACLFU9_03960 [Candidatus Bathyarchaeia archaeon]
MGPFISPQVNVVFQVVILVLLIISIRMKRRQKLSSHGITMLAAVILNVFSFGLNMLPSLLRTEIIGIQPFHAISMATLIHSGVGLVVMILSIWIVASWQLQSSLKYCFKNKRLMRLTTILWLAALLTGFLLYYLLYVY